MQFDREANVMVPNNTRTNKNYVYIFKLLCFVK